MGDAAAKLRTKLGEAHSTVQKFDTPLEQATRSSLDALQAYSMGNSTHVGGDDIFTGENREQYGYKDGWTSDGKYLYTGEGQVGDMRFVAGNRAIRDQPS